MQLLAANTVPVLMRIKRARIALLTFALVACQGGGSPEGSTNGGQGGLQNDDGGASGTGESGM